MQRASSRWSDVLWRSVVLSACIGVAGCGSDSADDNASNSSGGVDGGADYDASADTDGDESVVIKQDADGEQDAHREVEEAAKPDVGPDNSEDVVDSEVFSDAFEDAETEFDAADADGNNSCIPALEEFGLFDCSKLAAECQLPIGSSCGNNIHPVMCCDDSRSASNVIATVTDINGNPWQPGVFALRLATLIIDYNNGCPADQLNYILDMGFSPGAMVQDDGLGTVDFSASTSAVRDCYYALIGQRNEFDFDPVRIENSGDVGVALTPPANGVLDVGRIICQEGGLPPGTGDFNCYLQLAK